MCPTLFSIKASEAAVSLCVGVVGEKQNSEAAPRRRVQNGIYRRLKLSKTFFATQNGNRASIRKHL